MSRLPFRVRLTAVFAVAMTLLLLATGLFVYFRLRASLDHTLDNSLRSRADDVTALVRQSDTGLSEGGGAGLVEADESFAQVLQPGGAILDSSPQLRGRPLLTAAELERASQGPVFLDDRTAPGSDERVRLLAAPASARGERLVVVVGSSREARDEALSSLRTQLGLGFPAALLLASLLAYVLTARVLAPVESMRRQAAAIGAGEADRRLPVPESRDEIALLGETLNEMLGRLESALVRERRFVADASHELRTPLGLLKAELELALRRPRTREELESALRSAGEETDRLARLAEDLLVLARADDGKLPLRSERIDVGEMMARVVSRFATRPGTIETSAPPGLLFDGDALRIEQALGNLLDNALRHGGASVALSASEAADRLTFHVVDSGTGFDPELLPRAFERFTRGDLARTGGGTGLGLAIVKVIARAHGGEAGVANRPDGGADAWIALRSLAGARETPADRVLSEPWTGS